MCSDLTKQMDKERSVLAKLFGTSSVEHRKQPLAFNPMTESHNAESQRKKKSVVRPVTRDVIFLFEKCSCVPQNSQKMSLSEEGRMKSLVFKQTMTALQVQREIRRGFQSVCHEGPFLFLTASKENKLGESVIALPSGEDVCSKSSITVSVHVLFQYTIFYFCSW